MTQQAASPVNAVQAGVVGASQLGHSAASTLVCGGSEVFLPPPWLAYL